MKTFNLSTLAPHSALAPVAKRSGVRCSAGVSHSLISNLQSLISSLQSLILLLSLTSCGLLPSIGSAPPSINAPTVATQTRAPQSPASPSRAAPSPVAPSVEIENVPRLQKVADIKVTDPVRVTWSPDGKSLGVVTQAGFSLINAQTFQTTRTVAINQPTVLLDLSPDLRVYAQTTDQQSLELRDANTNALLRTIKPGGTFGDVVFAPDGKSFALTSQEDIAAVIWDAQRGQQTKKLSGFQTGAPVYEVAFSSDGKTLLWISRGIIQLMDVASGKLGAKFEHEDFIFDQALTHDGRTLVTAAEGTIIFWDVASGKKSKVSQQLTPTAIALSPGGRVLAVAAGNNILLWDVATQKQLRVLTGHSDRVTSVAFAPEGLTLASASDDDVVKVWGVK